MWFRSVPPWSLQYVCNVHTTAMAVSMHVCVISLCGFESHLPSKLLGDPTAGGQNFRCLSVRVQLDDCFRSLQAKCRSHSEYTDARCLNIVRIVWSYACMRLRRLQRLRCRLCCHRCRRHHHRYLLSSLSFGWWPRAVVALCVPFSAPDNRVSAPTDSL